MQQSIEPLLYAASDLQSRIYNILKQGFLETYGSGPEDRWRANATEYTCFLFAQYFGWAEATRQAALFKESLELIGSSNGSKADATSITSVIREVSDALKTDAYGKELMLFAGEQHAIGELMFRWEVVGERRFPSVMRYATFVARFRRDNDFRAWFDALLEPITNGIGDAGRSRLADVQNRLVDLMDLLDPSHSIYKQRAKIGDNRSQSSLG
ncbi:hypothetical protein GCM10009748_25450 [Agromyces lapidis]